MDFSYLLEEISRGFTSFSLGNAVMILVGVVLITLAVVKEYEPVLLLRLGLAVSWLILVCQRMWVL